jgi:hypothetical protein
MSNLQFIADFNAYKDDAVEFLGRVREQYNEHYGKWYQKHIDEDGDSYSYIEVDIRTGGWSDNEEVVHALLANSHIRMLSYEMWRRGGQHVFQFDPNLNQSF